MRVSKWRRKVRIKKRRLACLAGALVFGAVFLIRGAITLIGSSDERDATVQDSGIQTRVIVTPMAPSQQSVQKSLTICVYDHLKGITKVMALEEYVFYCLCAEVPANYHEEALRAQAVAVRTYAVSKLAAYGGNGCARSSGADVCTDSTHCQAYASEEELKQMWGGDYMRNAQKLRAAVADTASLVMLYDGAPILAMFHANSGGMTEDVEAVYSETLPYLRGVESDDPASEETVRYNIAEAASIVNKAYPAARVSADKLKSQLRVLSRFESGRADKCALGEITVTGKQLRALFGLSSSNTEISFSGEDVVFKTKGRGHGVGMSQEGAQEMAKAGHSFEEILGHYYQGIVIGSLGSTQ